MHCCIKWQLLGSCCKALSWSAAPQHATPSQTTHSPPPPLPLRPFRGDPHPPSHLRRHVVPQGPQAHHHATWQTKSRKDPHQPTCDATSSPRISSTSSSSRSAGDACSRCCTSRSTEYSSSSRSATRTSTCAAVGWLVGWGGLLAAASNRAKASVQSLVRAALSPQAAPATAAPPVFDCRPRLSPIFSLQHPQRPPCPSHK